MTVYTQCGSSSNQTNTLSRNLILNLSQHPITKHNLSQVDQWNKGLQSGLHDNCGKVSLSPVVIDTGPLLQLPHISHTQTTCTNIRTYLENDIKQAQTKKGSCFQGRILAQDLHIYVLV